MECAQDSRLESKVDYIIELLEKSKESNQRIERHITFIERIYEQLHTPLSYFKNQIMWLLGRPTAELDHISNQRDEENQ
jgi:hypothetical protein